jgi:predicted phosphodiesterase
VPTTERTKLACFGGVYSNHRALASTLADIRDQGADQAWCLGDLGGFGPHPDRAIDQIRAASVPIVRGNVDDSIGNGLDDCACGYDDPRDQAFSQISYDYTLDHTAAAHRDWMRELPAQQRMVVAGRTVLLCHGSPRRMNEFLWESSCSDAFLEWLCREHQADVIVCTHTGLHWRRALPSGRQVINVGAIGRPANDGRPGGWYAMIQLDRSVAVEFRHVAYDHEALAREMEAESLPAEFTETIRTGWWTTCLECLPAKERRRGRW